MFNIEINKGDDWKWKENITISAGQKSSTVTHSVKVFDKNIEPEKKTIKREMYDKFLDSFNSIDFHKVFLENKDIECLDSWTLACTISNGIVKINVEIWNQPKDNVNPETQKLLNACDQVFALFEE